MTREINIASQRKFISRKFDIFTTRIGKYKRSSEEFHESEVKNVSLTYITRCYLHLVKFVFVQTSHDDVKVRHFEEENFSLEFHFAIIRRRY